ncbi:MAG: hypothetical protein ACI9GW_001543 [Halieaceae bacterium]|jgi:hypothetical protein
MKTLTAMTLGLVMSTTALPTLAAQLDPEQLSQCKSELGAIYGDDARFKLKSINGRKNKMRIKTIPVDGESLTVTCWKDSSGTIQLIDREGVALVNPSYDPTDKISDND